MNGEVNWWSNVDNFICLKFLRKSKLSFDRERWLWPGYQSFEKTRLRSANTESIIKNQSTATESEWKKVVWPGTANNSNRRLQKIGVKIVSRENPLGGPSFVWASAECAAWRSPTSSWFKLMLSFTSSASVLLWEEIFALLIGWW